MDGDFQIQYHDGPDYPEWGSAPRRPLVQFDGAHKGEWMESVIGPDPLTGKSCIYHIVRCEMCITTHVWPLPSDDALATYYKTTFYQTDKSDMVLRYERDRAWWEQCVHEPILRRCRMSDVLHSPEEQQPRFLDIGAGPGIALDVARNTLGWETSGIEPNHNLCAALRQRGHAMHVGMLDTDPSNALQFQKILGKFHCLYAYEVLEHQANPEDFLLACAEMLEDRGYLVIVVPNDYNPLQFSARKELGMAPWWLAPPQHLQYFTPKTLQLLVRRCGFTLKDMRGTYAMEKFLLRGHNYIGNDDIGRICHQQRIQEELFIMRSGLWGSYEKQMRRDLAEKRHGREIVCIAQKA